MKRISLLLLIMVLLFAGCKNNTEEGDSDMRDIKYESGVFHDKNWNEKIGTYVDVAVPDKETAIKIASAVIIPMQDKGYAKNYSVQSVFFDNTDEVWIVSFWEDKGDKTTGADCSIAIKKSNSQILRIWFGE